MYERHGQERAARAAPAPRGGQRPIIGLVAKERAGGRGPVLVAAERDAAERRGRGEGARPIRNDGPRRARARRVAAPDVVGRDFDLCGCLSFEVSACLELFSPTIRVGAAASPRRAAFCRRADPSRTATSPRRRPAPPPLVVPHNSHAAAAPRPAARPPAGPASLVAPRAVPSAAAATPPQVRPGRARGGPWSRPRGRGAPADATRLRETIGSVGMTHSERRCAALERQWRPAGQRVGFRSAAARRPRTRRGAPPQRPRRGRRRRAAWNR